MIKNLQREIGEFQNICKSNFVFPECGLIDLFEEEIVNMEVIVPKGEIMYRARVYDDNIFDKFKKITEDIHQGDNDQNLKNACERGKELVKIWKENKESGFYGYDKEGSFVNKNWKSIQSGRCNHEFECCLYAAEDIETAISELKPLIKENISVAQLKVCQNLRLIDLSLDYEQKKENLKNIMGIFFLTSPTEINKDAYIYSQIICSIVKKQGYDGIIYSSCQNQEKKNYAIFNYDKCEAISSEVYYVTDIKYKYEKRLSK